MWIVIDIGCLHCGASSEIVGLFSEEQKAIEIATECNQKYNWQGEKHAFMVRPLPEPDVINPVWQEDIDRWLETHQDDSDDEAGTD